MKKNESADLDYEVAVVGGGFSGSVIGLKAAELGLNVRVFDNRHEYPDLFRAEKLETDQHEALEQLGLIGLVRPVEFAYIDHVHEFVGRKERLVPCSKHRGIYYQDTVNAFRSSLQDRGLLEVRKVSRLRDTVDCCEIEFDDSTTVRARLAVIATGGSQVARKSLNLESHEPDALRSTTFGFYVEPTSADRFQAEAFNQRLEHHVTGFHYATFFPVGDRMRVNVFTCWHPGSARAKEFRADPMTAMRQLFPHLEDQVGPFRLAGELQVFTTHYYRQDCSHLKSSVLVGDDFQSVSPATGMGLSKCLTDVRALLRVLRHLSERKSDLPGLQLYFENDDKKSVDDSALNKWKWAVETATSRSLKTKLKMLKRRLFSSRRRAGLPAAP